MANDVGVVVSNIRCTAAIARDLDCMELGQWLQILPVYYFDAVLPALPAYIVAGIRIYRCG